jgi:hypothetical protein
MRLRGPDAMVGTSVLDIDTGTTTRKGHAMPEFMDVHSGMAGVTSEQLAAAHHADLAIQADEEVDFKRAWADPTSGMVFCLSEAPDADAVQRIHQRSGHPADAVYAVTLTA